LTTGDPSLIATSFPSLHAWSERILSREGVKKGIPEGEFLGQMMSQPGWEEGVKKSFEWVWAEESAEAGEGIVEGDKKRKKDEL